MQKCRSCLQNRRSDELSGHSLVGVMSLRQHVGLQLGKVALLVPTLANPHVQQMRVYSCVVGLQQPSLNGLCCRETHTQASVTALRGRISATNNIDP